jgi:hypothetical protein
MDHSTFDRFSTRRSLSHDDRDRHGPALIVDLEQLAYHKATGTAMPLTMFARLNDAGVLVR